MEQPLDRIAKPTVGAVPPADSPMTTGQAPPHPDNQPLSPSVVAVLLARGNALLATGDVAAARLMYERVARSDSGPAATAMGITCDPRFLAQIGAQGIAPDPQRTAIWYRRAADLGGAEGRSFWHNSRPRTGIDLAAALAGASPRRRIYHRIADADAATDRGRGPGCH
jgi:hypothetical protein